MFTAKVPLHTQELMALLAPLLPPKTYLAGGTALCLHLDHRSSFDIDLYTPHHFDEKKYLKLWRTSLPEFEVLYTSEQTIGGKVTNGEINLFYFEYPLLETPSQFNGIPIASIADIGAMKIEAIASRGLKRDFFDLYIICQQR
ncbi:hypothetical protein A2W24_05665 [Microgenomates group bacterium RBG_16_45_19]|nr:MAG: hypothetical protein A2W24_05665 [Microgenomates group bacterium RBG_16_45_19]